LKIFPYRFSLVIEGIYQYIHLMGKKVGIVRCASYDPQEVYGTLKKAFELSDKLDVAGKTVLLKPNILSDSPPEKAITTHPVFLEAAIRLVRENGAGRVLVGDSPGLQMPGFSGKASGLGEATRKNGAEWIDFTKGKIEVSCPDGKVIKSFTLTQAAREADLIISLPKLKTHQLMQYTGAMKNIFGLVPSLAKSPFHARFPSREAFAAMIVDLNLAVKPAFAFMDAIIGMEGNGPAAGNPRQIGLVMASSNLLAMDIAATQIMGYPPKETPVNKEALNRKCWLSSIEEIEYPCLSPSGLQIPDFAKIPFKASPSQFLDFILPKPLKRWKDSFAPGPEINHQICVRCGDCKRICGSQAISIVDDENTDKKKSVVIDYRRCIRCFCCHEICTVKAIGVKTKPQNHI
jgi:uncharacterized protein (DUF362 family)/Pyruvate/2-oxoacid:ferredoxin oxidoreductase delta subunit